MSLIVNKGQVGFITGRNIASHIRLFGDTAKYLNQRNKPAALITLDFSIAFETLSKPCILDALDIFKYGIAFENLVNTVMKNTQSCVHNGGWIESSFRVERGISKGAL